MWKLSDIITPPPPSPPHSPTLLPTHPNIHTHTPTHTLTHTPVSQIYVYFFLTKHKYSTRNHAVINANAYHHHSQFDSACILKLNSLISDAKWEIVFFFLKGGWWWGGGGGGGGTLNLCFFHGWCGSSGLASLHCLKCLLVCKDPTGGLVANFLSMMIWHFCGSTQWHSMEWKHLCDTWHDEIYIYIYTTWLLPCKLRSGIQYDDMLWHAVKGILCVLSLKFHLVTAYI